MAEKAWNTEAVMRMVAYVPLFNEEGVDVGYWNSDLLNRFAVWLEKTKEAARVESADAVERVKALVLGDDTEEWVRGAGGACMVSGWAILEALDGDTDG